MQLTGHPFVDAGLAGVAALLEQENQGTYRTPTELTSNDILIAVCILKTKYYYRLVKKERGGSERPLFYFLLQEILPGSSWDQVKTGDVVKMMKEKFEAYTEKLVNAALNTPIGKCALTGLDAHVAVGKSEIPMLSSVEERPNIYPNLNDGMKVNAFVPLAILFSPLGIEKTVNEKGKGGLNIIYHTYHWRFAISIAKRNLKKLNFLLLSNSIEGFRKNYFGKTKLGSWKIALMTLFHSLNDIPPEDQPQTVLWTFNATNQGGRFESIEISSSFIQLHKKRLLYPSAYRQFIHCNDVTSKMIIQSNPIARASVITFENKKTKNKIDNTFLIPGWSLQRLYAQEVLHMPTKLLNAVERAANILAADAQAVNYCVFEKIRPLRLVKDFKVPNEIIAIFSDYHNSWKDYLRAAVVWASKGNQFTQQPVTQIEFGEIESMIKSVSQKLCKKFSSKRLAMMLSLRSIFEYRSKWIGLIRVGACDWQDFLYFNPIDEAFMIGNYSRTKMLKDYLVAYLFGLSLNTSERDNADDIEILKNEYEDTVTFDESEQLEELS